MCAVILLDDLESGALAMTRSGTVQHRANRMNGLAVTADDAADVRLTKLHFEDRHLAARNFREHHVVRKFDELTDDELEKFLHRLQISRGNPVVTRYSLE